MKNLLMILASTLLVSVNAIAQKTQTPDLPSMHHLVHQVPESTQFIPKGWPLNDRGEIDCETCHGDKEIEKKKFEDVDKQAQDFLLEGPYQNLSDFCFRCHEQDSYQRPNIHVQIGADGDLLESSCFYCHKNQPDIDSPETTEEPELRMAAGDSCLACHLKSPHLNASNHLLKLPEKMLKRKDLAEKKAAVKLPLNKEGKITCVTCHSPHQDGVIPAYRPAGKQVKDVSVEEGIRYAESDWSDVYYRDKEARLKHWIATRDSGILTALDYKKIEAEVLLRLSAKTGALCFACHGFENERRR